MRSFPAFGFTMYQAIPARCAPPSGLMAVSRAPQSFPFAYITCCIRVSFESGLATTSVRTIPVMALMWAAAETSSFQQPNCPLNNSVVSSFRQWPWGTLVSGAVPEPGWCCFGGTPYWPTVSTLFVRLSAGTPFSEAVLVNDQTMSWSEVRVPATPETGFCASSAAFELRKFSVPLAARLYEPVPGDCAGQSVKPGCVDPASLG